MQTRKSHRKSRLGCKTCKQRKVKCDERQPTCARCDASGRECSYLNVPSYLVPDRVGSYGNLRQGALLEPLRHTPTADAPTPPRVDEALAASECYSLLHFELYSHFKDRLVAEAISACPDIQLIFDVAVREPFRTPYLMDQMLALAASHKSTLSEHDRDWYRHEALRLQTRAIGQFNRAETHGNPLAPFVYSTLLGQQALFDAFSSASDLPATLDKMTHCLELHKGIAAVVGDAMARATSVFEDYMAGSPAVIDDDAISGSECDGLVKRLRMADLPETTLEVYLNVARVLQYLFDSVKKSKRGRLAAVQEWLVRAKDDYISLLKQRRPEALILLAYYGVLLHQARDYWAFSGSGSLLVRGISGHLGDYWSEWLEWPNAQIREEPNRTFWSVMSSP